jgi:hypothetical protein
MDAWNAWMVILIKTDDTHTHTYVCTVYKESAPQELASIVIPTGRR